MECTQRITSVPGYNGMQMQGINNMLRKMTCEKENRDSMREVLVETKDCLKEANYKDLSFVKSLCYKNQKFQEDLEIHSYLNSGSCGVVYSGEIKKSMNRKVALKLLVSNKVTKVKREKIMRREIQIMQKLKNKHSVNLYGIYEVGDKETVCMLM